MMNYKKEHKDCFACEACSIDCPNTAIESYNARFGGECLAEDLGYEQIKCSECRYNTYRCGDCMLYASEDCPKTIEYTSDNGYKGVLYGERSFAIYEVESGKCKLHTGFRNINTYDELVKQVEDFPRFIEWLGTATDDLIDREGVEDEEEI